MALHRSCKSGPVSAEIALSSDQVPSPEQLEPIDMKITVVDHTSRSIGVLLLPVRCSC